MKPGWYVRLGAGLLAIGLCGAAQAAPDTSRALMRREATLDRLGQQFRQYRDGVTLSDRLRQNLERWRFDAHQRREMLGFGAAHADESDAPVLKLERQRLRRERAVHDLRPPGPD